jgi:hypothetical protein
MMSTAEAKQLIGWINAGAKVAAPTERPTPSEFAMVADALEAATLEDYESRGEKGPHSVLIARPRRRCQ